MHANENGRSNWQPIWSWLIISLLIVGFMVWNLIFVQGKILRDAEKYYMQEQIGNITSSLEQVEQEGQKLTQQVAANAKLQAALQEDNGAQMDKLLQPVYKQWQKHYGVKELDLISSRGAVIWSSDSDLNAGDDMSYQRIVTKSLREKVRLSALESNESENLIVTTLPLFSGNKFLGLCKVAFPMQSLGDKLKKLNTGKYAIYNLNGIESNLVWENKKGEESLNTADLKKLHDGQIFSKSLDWKTILTVVPLKDIDGVTVTYIQAQISTQTFRQVWLNNYILLIFLILFMLLVNYIFGLRKMNSKSDYGDGFAKLSKINNVSFNIDSEKVQKYFGDEQ